jgi:C1A family cysteine protease
MCERDSKERRCYNYPVFRPEFKKPKPLHFELQTGKLQAPLALPASYQIPVPFPAYDQGPIGSCVANATAAAYRIQESPALQTPSRMFIYTAGKEREGYLSGSGMVLDDGLECLNLLGVCPETVWPYDVRKETTKPSAAAYTAAKPYKIKGWGQVAHTLNSVKRILLNNIPVLIGILVYESFEGSLVAGQIPMPNKARESVLGGHCMCVVGYDDSKASVLALNSWGPNWGVAGGKCWLPYDYLMDGTLTDEFLYSTGPVPPPPPPPRPAPARHRVLPPVRPRPRARIRRF